MVNVSVPDCAPIAVGEKMTFAVQVPPAARLPEQLVETEYCPELVIDEMVTVVLPVLDSVTACAVELAPTVTLPKLREPTLVVSAVLRPVPDKDTVWLPALVANVNVPDCVPIVVGLKRTFAAQVPPTARVLEQVVVVEYWPVAETDVMLRVVLPVFERVTVCADELEPRFTLPNVKAEVLVDADVCSPVPDREAVLFPALVVKVSVPDWVPIVVGAKMTLAVQLAPAASEDRQVVEVEYCPVAATDVIPRAVLPEFVRVTVCADELAPRFTLPKDKVLTLVVATASKPVPDRDTDWFPALVVKVTVPA